MVESQWSQDARMFADWEVGDMNIEVKVVESLIPDETPREVWDVSVISVPHTDQLDYETMAQLAGALTTEGGYPAPHAIDYRKGFTEWGASGVGQSILLLVSDVVLAGVAYDALKATVVALADRARSQADWEPEPLTAEEAVARAESHLGSAYGLFGADHRFIGELVGEEERADGSRVVRFVSGDRRFEVELVDERGLVVIARTSWSSNP